jgi:hypothetical protein
MVPVHVETLVRVSIIPAMRSCAARWSCSWGVPPPHLPSARRLHPPSSSCLRSDLAVSRACCHALRYPLRCAALRQLVFGGTNQGCRDRADPQCMAARQPLHIIPSMRRQTTTVRERRHDGRRCASAAPHNHNAERFALGRHPMPGSGHPCGDFCRGLGSASGPASRGCGAEKPPYALRVAYESL